MLNINKLTFFIKKQNDNCSLYCERRRFSNLKNNALSKIPILPVVVQFRIWTSFHSIWWHFLFCGRIACMNTTAQPIISCVLHSLQFATNIF